MKKLVLIDGHAILHRAFHAFPQTLRTRKGEVVNAVYGFTRMLLTVIGDLQPEFLAVTFDLPKPTFRHKEFLGYQAQRPKMDEVLSGQIERVRQVVMTLGIPIYAKEGFEADDVIATLAKQALKARSRKESLEVVVVTGDKDMMQLVGRKVKIYSPVKGFSQAKLFGEKEVEELLGVEPDQVVDYKALVGDASDNYPGVAGIGPKTAVDLLSRFKTLERIYKKIDDLDNEKLREKLREGRESALLSQKLARIVTDAPVKLDLKGCRVHEYDREAARKLFEELEFRSLLRKLPGAAGSGHGAGSLEQEEKKDKGEQMKLL